MFNLTNCHISCVLSAFILSQLLPINVQCSQRAHEMKYWADTEADAYYWLFWTYVSLLSTGLLNLSWSVSVADLGLNIKGQRTCGWFCVVCLFCIFGLYDIELASERHIVVNFIEAIKLCDLELLPPLWCKVFGHNAYINTITANFVSKFPNYRYHDNKSRP